MKTIKKFTAIQLGTEKVNNNGNIEFDTEEEVIEYTDNIMKEIEEAQYTLYKKFIDIVDNCYLILSDEDFKRLEDYCKNVLGNDRNPRIERLNFQFGEIIVKETRTTETSHLLTKRKEAHIFVKCNLGTNEITTSNN